MYFKNTDDSQYGIIDGLILTQAFTRSFRLKKGIYRVLLVGGGGGTAWLKASAWDANSGGRMAAGGGSGYATESVFEVTDESVIYTATCGSGSSSIAGGVSRLSNSISGIMFSAAGGQPGTTEDAGGGVLYGGPGGDGGSGGGAAGWLWGSGANWTWSVPGAGGTNGSNGGNASNVGSNTGRTGGTGEGTGYFDTVLKNQSVASIHGFIIGKHGRAGVGKGGGAFNTSNNQACSLGGGGGGLGNRIPGWGDTDRNAYGYGAGATPSINSTSGAISTGNGNTGLVSIRRADGFGTPIIDSTIPNNNWVVPDYVYQKTASNVWSPLQEVYQKTASNTWTKVWPSVQTVNTRFKTNTAGNHVVRLAAGVYSIFLVGGGGGASGNLSATNIPATSGGGGSGYALHRIITITETDVLNGNNVLSITVGAGGTKGAGGGNGTNGGNTTYTFVGSDAVYVANGGKGAVYQSSGARAQGGDGGSGGGSAGGHVSNIWSTPGAGGTNGTNGGGNGARGSYVIAGPGGTGGGTGYYDSILASQAPTISGIQAGIWHGAGYGVHGAGGAARGGGNTNGSAGGGGGGFALLEPIHLYSGSGYGAGGAGPSMSTDVTLGRGQTGYCSIVNVMMPY